MHSRIVLLAIAATLPLSVFSQATTTAAAVPTAIVPFGTLPTCALLCGPLFDAQGACSPPVDTSCFCKYPSLQPFYAGDTGVCQTSQSGVCTGSDLSTVQTWFLGLCGSSASSVASLTAAPTVTATGTNGQISATATSAPSGSSGSGNQTWLSTHWQYVVMIVVIVIGIIVIWVGACLWRRRRLRKKDMQYELRPPGVPWAESSLKAGPPYGYADGIVAPGAKGAKGKSAVRYGITPAEVQAEKAGRKKWIVKERT